MRICTPLPVRAHSYGEFHRDTLSGPPQIFKRHHATMLPSILAAQSIRFRDRKYTHKMNRGESKGDLACFQKFRQHLRRPIWRRAKSPSAAITSLSLFTCGCEIRIQRAKLTYTSSFLVESTHRTQLECRLSYWLPQNRTARVVFPEKNDYLTLHLSTVLAL